MVTENTTFGDLLPYVTCLNVTGTQWVSKKEPFKCVVTVSRCRIPAQKGADHVWQLICLYFVEGGEHGWKSWNKLKGLGFFEAMAKKET